jgi:hypothetical protein
MNHKLALQTLTHSTTATFQLRSAHLTSPHPIKLIGTIRAAILHTAQYTTQLSPQLHLLSTTYTTRDAAIQRHLPHSPSLSLKPPQAQAVISHPTNPIPPSILKSHIPLDSGNLLLAHSATPALDIGALSRLPTKLQHCILRTLDVRSILAFRRVNKHAISVVEQLEE